MTAHDTAGRAREVRLSLRDWLGIAVIGVGLIGAQLRVNLQVERIDERTQNHKERLDSFERRLDNVDGGRGKS